MTDDELFATCVWTEARGEPYEGMAAVARVVWNRINQKWFSDGTVSGTVLAKDQFSAFYFDMVDDHYTRVCSTREEATVRAEVLFAQASASAQWAECQKAVTDGKPGATYPGGPTWDKFAAEPRALMYANLAISNPAWATADKRICQIYSHTFFRA